MLKRAEGIVTLTLCNPNKDDDKPAEKKKDEPPPEPEKPKDPATDPVSPNKETLIEINCEKKPLGIVVVKGDSSVVQVGI